MGATPPFGLYAFGNQIDVSFVTLPGAIQVTRALLTAMCLFESVASARRTPIIPISTC